MKMKEFISYEKGIEILEKSFDKRATKEYVNLLDAQDRVLACDVKAEQSCPIAPTASMDGYAIKSQDQELGVLKLTDKVPAGSEAKSIEKGECIKTFTGSLMSKGSDTLIPIENVEAQEDSIKILKPVPKGFAVRPEGESYSKDEVLIKQGTRLGYAQMATLAEQGVVQVCVYAKPRIAILATGEELVELGGALERPSQIRSSNHIALYALAQKLGAKPLLLGIAGDDKELIKKRILEGLESADIVVTTGGVSVGDYDFVKEVLSELEVEYLLHGSAIKPGRHIRIVKAGQKYIFSLPGFPYSSIVAFYLYVLRLICYKTKQDFDARFCEAYLDEDYKKRSRFTEFTACNVEKKDGKLFVNLTGKKQGSSAIVTNLLNDAALLCVPKETEFIPKGSKVKIMLLD